MLAFSRTIVLGGFFTLFLWLPLKAQEVSIPDSIFRAYLLNNPLINQDTDDKITVAEAASATQLIIFDSFGKLIQDMTGLEAFVNLESIFFYELGTDSLPLSNLSKLKVLRVHRTFLKSLNLAGNPALENLECWECELEEIDLSQQSQLKRLFLEDSRLDTLELVHQSQLESISVRENFLTGLDLSGASNLKELIVNQNRMQWLIPPVNNNIEDYAASYNDWGSMDLRGWDMLSDFRCIECGLDSIILPQSPRLRLLTLNRNRLKNLDLQGTPAIMTLSLDDNLFTSFDLEGGLNSLQTLRFARNQLQRLNTRGAAFLSFLDCSGNQLSSLDLQVSPGLEFLRANQNPLESLELAQSGELRDLFVREARLESLDLSAQTGLLAIDLTRNALTSLVLPDTGLLGRLIVDDNPELPHLDISKQVNLNLFSVSRCSGLEYVCVWELPFNTSLLQLVLDGTNFPFVLCAGDFPIGFPKSFEDVSLQPNPATEKVSLVYDRVFFSEGAPNIWLYDQQGRLHRSWKGGTVWPTPYVVLDLSGLLPGVYMVRCDGELPGSDGPISRTVYKKLMVQ